MVSGHSFIQSFSTQKALIYGAQTACSRIRSAKVGLGGQGRVRGRSGVGHRSGQKSGMCSRRSARSRKRRSSGASAAGCTPWRNRPWQSCWLSTECWRWCRIYRPRRMSCRRRRALLGSADCVSQAWQRPPTARALSWTASGASAWLDPTPRPARGQSSAVHMICCTP